MQPHRLTMHFVRQVELRAIRFFVDYNEDESYTPTSIKFYGGWSPNTLEQFAQIRLENPTGWQDVPLTGAGGGPDGNSVCTYVVVMEITENHQNGKDTHIRGIKLYGPDDSLSPAMAGAVTGNPLDDMLLQVEDAAMAVLNSPSFAARASASDSPHIDRGDPVRLLDMSDALDRGLRPSSRRPLKPGGMGRRIPDYMRDPELR